MRRTLTLVVHGEAGAGKSYLADTIPAPRLIIDVEGGLRFTPSRKVLWDPRKPIPEVDGTWDTAVVQIGPSYRETLSNVYGWLNEGAHPFRGVAIDSMSELAEKIMSSIATGLPQIQDYGNLYYKINPVVKSFRDLRDHSVNPVDVVMFVCGTQEKGKEKGVMRPAIIGKTANAIGYAVDVMGFMSVSINQANEVKRTLTFVPLPGISAKDRTGKLGTYMDDPSIPKMLDAVYGEEKK
jgi:hypothetical protein